MGAVGMDMVGVAIARAEHTGSYKRGGRTEKRSAFHADEFLPACLFCQPSMEMRWVVINDLPDVTILAGASPFVTEPSHTATAIGMRSVFKVPLA